MFDCHMHSKFSADSVMDAADACKAAISLGLDGIAFTDHVDFDYPGETFIVDFDRYMERINDLAAVYEGKLRILRAIEAGIQPHVIEDTLKVVNSYPFDYVLASVHIIDGADPYVKEEYYQGKSKAEAYERYLKEIYNMIMHFGSFDMVGHFEYIIRYAQYVDRSLRYADHRDILDSILKELVHQGRGFEVNTGSFRDPAAMAVYDAEVLKRYRELGGELVCLGSDAHRPEHIALRFDYFAQLIRDAGFRYTVHFENRKPVYDKL